MFGFQSGLEIISLDTDKYNKRLNKELGIIIREGARVWLRTWILLGIPVETGAAKAAFQPLGKFLRVAVNISPTRKPYTSSLYGELQNTALGRKLSTFEVVDDKNNANAFVFRFTWETDILHYFLEQYYKGKAIPGPKALEQASKAMDEFVKEQLRKKAPRVDRALNFRPIRLVTKFNG